MLIVALKMNLKINIFYSVHTLWITNMRNSYKK